MIDFMFTTIHILNYS